MLNGLDACVVLSCFELLARKQLKDTWIFWVVFVIAKFIGAF